MEFGYDLFFFGPLKQRFAKKDGILTFARDKHDRPHVR